MASTTSRLGQGAQDLARRRSLNRPTPVVAEPGTTQPSAAAPVLKAAVEVIARHPLNPRGVVVTLNEEGGSSEDFDALVKSIRELGVLQPLVVTRRELFVQMRPDLAGELFDGAEWVLIAGERRLRAAEVAGLKSVPITSGDELMAGLLDVEAMVVENVNRKALSPLQEAHAYQMLVDDGQSQRLIAQRVGRVQSHISKRLRLLGLPADAQEKIRTGDLGIKDAEALTAVAAKDLDAVWADAQRHGVSHAVRLNEHRKETAAMERKLRKKAEQAAAEQGIPLLPGRDLPSGADWYTAQVTTDADIAAARDAGTLAAVQPWAATDEIRLVDTSRKPTEKEERAGGDRALRREQERQAERDRKIAAKARREHLAALAGSRRPISEVAAELADTVIARADTEVTRLASKLMPTLGAENPDTAARAGDYDAWRQQIAGASPADRLIAARLLGLARLDSHTHTPWRSTYDHESVAYIERLETETDYQRTAYDTAHWPSAEDLAAADPFDAPDYDTEDEDEDE